MQFFLVINWPLKDKHSVTELMNKLMWTISLTQVWKVHLGDVHGRDRASGIGETEEERSALWRGRLLPHGHQGALLHQICLRNWSVRKLCAYISCYSGSARGQNIIQFACAAATLRVSSKNKNTAKRQQQQTELYQVKHQQVFFLFLPENSCWNQDCAILNFTLVLFHWRSFLSPWLYAGWLSKGR